MNTYRHRPIATALVGLVALGISGVSVASAQPTDSGHAPVRCHWTAVGLPRTPDAVEAWYRGCSRSDVLNRPTGVAKVAPSTSTGSGNAPVRCHWTAVGLPRTPDAVEAWYRGCSRS